MSTNQQASRGAFTNTDNASKDAFTNTDNDSKEAFRLPDTAKHCNCCTNHSKPAKQKTTEAEALVNGIFLASENRQSTKPAGMRLRLRLSLRRKTDNHEANTNFNTTTMTNPPTPAMPCSRPINASNITTFVAPTKIENTSNKKTNTVQNPARFVKTISHPVQKTANFVNATAATVQKPANPVKTTVQKTANFVNAPATPVQKTDNFVKTTAAPVAANPVKISVQKTDNFVKTTAAPVRKPANAIKTTVQTTANFVKTTAAPVHKPANPVKTTVQKTANLALDILVRQRLLASEQRLSELHQAMWKEIADREAGMAREIFHIRANQMLPHQTRPPPPQHSVAWIASLVSSSRPNSTFSLTSTSSLGSSWETCS